MAAKKRLEFRAVERLAVDVGVDLHAERAEVLHRALGLAHAGVGRRQRGLRDEGGEFVRMLAADLGEAVVADAAEVLDHVVLDEGLERRHRIGQDLGVVREHVDDLHAHVEVVDRRNAAHALADVLRVAGHFGRLFDEFFRNEVRVRVDSHGPVLLFGNEALMASAARRKLRQQACAQALATTGREPQYGADHIDQRLAALVHHHVACPCERRGQVLRALYALAMAALHLHDRLERRRRSEMSANSRPSFSPAAPSLNIPSVAARTAP